MVSKIAVFAIQVAVLLIISAIFFFWKSTALVILFFVIWLDKAVLVHLKVHMYFGVELITIPVVIAGIIYGPVFGFLFGFLILPLTAGLFEMISWTISQPMEVSWLPVIPSPNTFSAGMAGLIAGLMAGNPFLIIVIACAATKNVFDYIAMKITNSEAPIGIAIPMNFFYNAIAAFLVAPYFIIH